jgi:hypothetical protein
MNRIFAPKEDENTGLRNKDAVCFLHGRNRISRYNFDEYIPSKF